MLDLEPELIASLVQDNLRAGRTPYMRVSSDSMAPLLRKGDQIGLATPAGLAKPGDIVVLRGASSFVVHRLWGRVGEEIVTKGDRSLTFDAPWSPETFVGCVVSRRRSIRTLSLKHGVGGRLQRHLWNLSRLEAGLFAGFSHNPLTHSDKGRFLGRRLRRNRRDLLTRLVRRLMYTWASILTSLAGLGATKEVGLHQTDASQVVKMSKTRQIER